MLQAGTVIAKPDDDDQQGEQKRPAHVQRFLIEIRQEEFSLEFEFLNKIDDHHRDKADKGYDHRDIANLVVNVGDCHVVIAKGEHLGDKFPSFFDARGHENDFADGQKQDRPKPLEDGPKFTKDFLFFDMGRGIELLIKGSKATERMIIAP